MIKGCREPPYPSILTDATMEKLALAKFVAQESKCEVSSGAAAITARGGGSGDTRPVDFSACLSQACDVVVRFYGLVHWEDPMDEALGPTSNSCASAENAVTKDGILHYKAGTSYLGKEQWKTCFVVLRWAAGQERGQPGLCGGGAEAALPPRSCLGGRWRGPILSPGRFKPPSGGWNATPGGCRGGGQGRSGCGPGRRVWERTPVTPLSSSQRQQRDPVPVPRPH